MNLTGFEKTRRIYKNTFPDVSYINSEGLSATRPFHSLNVSKVVSRKLSKLVFNDGCDITVDDDNADKFLQEVFSDNKFRKNFGEELEAGYAIGGLALRPYVDTNTGKIKISYCRADTFYPLQSNTNDISEAAIATVTQQAEGQKTVYYTLLEFHEWENRNVFSFAMNCIDLTNKIKLALKFRWPHLKNIRISKMRWQ